MKISTKGRYAVMAMIDIGQNSGGAPVSLAEISERQLISQEYLEQIFLRLRKSGLVVSVRGPGGGYRLAHESSAIMVMDIIEAVEESIRFTRCEGDAVDGCLRGERCCAHDLWASLSRQVDYFLSSVTLDDVINRRNLALSAAVKQAKDRHGEPAWANAKAIA